MGGRALWLRVDKGGCCLEELGSWGADEMRTSGCEGQQGPIQTGAGKRVSGGRGSEGRSCRRGLVSRWAAEGWSDQCDGMAMSLEALQCCSVNKVGLQLRLVVSTLPILGFSLQLGWSRRFLAAPSKFTRGLTSGSQPQRRSLRHGLPLFYSLPADPIEFHPYLLYT